MGLPSSEPSGRGRCSESIWCRNTGKNAGPDLKISGTERRQASWKERMRARTKAMRKVKGKITQQEDREWEAGVTEKSI